MRLTLACLWFIFSVGVVRWLIIKVCARQKNGYLVRDINSTIYFHQSTNICLMKCGDMIILMMRWIGKLGNWCHEQDRKFELAQFTKISEQLGVLFLSNKLILLKWTDINDLNCINNIQHWCALHKVQGAWIWQKKHYLTKSLKHVIM